MILAPFLLFSTKHTWWVKYHSPRMNGFIPLPVLYGVSCSGVATAKALLLSSTSGS